MTDEERASTIRALLHEREGYERRGGLEDRIEQVNAELKRLGHEARAPAERAARRIRR